MQRQSQEIALQNRLSQIAQKASVFDSVKANPVAPATQANEPNPPASDNKEAPAQADLATKDPQTTEPSKPDAGVKHTVVSIFGKPGGLSAEGYQRNYQVLPPALRPM